ncbi:hypothetical protein J3E74DRAFT_402814 [Bipolaris maydis]|nr:hypothetical protein J3E74DRAFT_402814 [Bipolaris maydis]
MSSAPSSLNSRILIQPGLPTLAFPSSSQFDMNDRKESIAVPSDAECAISSITELQ